MVSQNAGPLIRAILPKLKKFVYLEIHKDFIRLCCTTFILMALKNGNFQDTQVPFMAIATTRTTAILHILTELPQEVRCSMEAGSTRTLEEFASSIVEGGAENSRAFKFSDVRKSRNFATL